MTNNATNFHDSSQSDVHGIPRFRDYSIRIWNDEDGSLIGTYINADFTSSAGAPRSSEDFNTDNSDSEPYNGIFYHMSDDHLSIELGTHDEHLISEVVSLCKEISNKFLMLDGLLAVINKEK